MKRLILDIDETISRSVNGRYSEAVPISGMREKIIEYRELGFEVVFHSSRNMRSYEGNVGKINKHTLPIIIKWLHEHDIPYDEIYVGKPWCGFEGFYVDDKAIRPDEFLINSYDEILKILDLSSKNLKLTR